MLPTVTDRVARSLCRSVTVVSPAKTPEPIAMPFVDSNGPKEACVTWGAHWRHLANTTEPSMCGGDAAFLWSPYGIGQTIIFSSCRLFFLLSPYVIGQTIIFSSRSFFLPSYFYLLFFSSPNLSGRRLDVYHTSTHGVALVRI